MTDDVFTDTGDGLDETDDVAEDRAAEILAAAAERRGLDPADLTGE